MKYPEQMYIDSQIFAGDLDGSESNFSEKIVKIRKPHECCVCEKEIQKGEKMLMQRAIIDGMGWCRCYICLPCIEKWLEESGQVGEEDGKMREILFKAKKMGNGEWVEGDLSYIVHDKKRMYVFPAGGLDSADRYEVYPETLCQYTGLKDKNGKRIWENDIVSFIDCSSTESGYVEHNCVGRVAWDCECASFRVSGTLSAEAWVLQDCVVIGNIFDNPELLGQDDG